MNKSTIVRYGYGLVIGVACLIDTVLAETSLPTREEIKVARESFWQLTRLPCNSESCGLRVNPDENTLTIFDLATQIENDYPVKILYKAPSAWWERLFRTQWTDDYLSQYGIRRWTVHVTALEVNIGDHLVYLLGRNVEMTLDLINPPDRGEFEGFSIVGLEGDSETTVDKAKLLSALDDTSLESPDPVASDPFIARTDELSERGRVALPHVVAKAVLAATGMFGGLWSSLVLTAASGTTVPRIDLEQNCFIQPSPCEGAGCEAR